MSRFQKRKIAEFVSAHDYPCWCGTRAATVFCAQMFRRKFVALACEACGTHRILPRALHTQSEATDVYNLEEHTRAVIPNSVLEENARKILERIQQVGIVFAGGKTVIDIGCSDGLLIDTIRERWSCQVIGVDVDQRSIHLARQKYPNVNFIHGRFDEVIDTLPAADVVIASAILEHVTSPPEFLSMLKHLLKPGGQLFLLTPNSESRNYRIQRSWWRELLAIGEHIYLFGPRSIGILADQAGLETRTMATAYDPTILRFGIRSPKELIVLCWSLVRYSVQRLCQLKGDDLKGDILSVRLEHQPDRAVAALKSPTESL